MNIGVSEERVLGGGPLLSLSDHAIDGFVGEVTYYAQPANSNVSEARTEGGSLTGIPSA